MALVRRLVELGRAARAESKVKTRQPLARALISAPGWDSLPGELRAQVADELNVVELASLAAAADLVDVAVKANFRALGKRFGSGTQAVAKAVAAADAMALATALRDTGTATVEVDGAQVSLTAEDVIVSETPRSGWAVASEGPDTVALDLELSTELRRLGTLRDIIRIVQEARKNAGFEVTDRIRLQWRVGGSPEPAEAIRAHRDELAREVLAAELVEGPPDAPDAFFEATDADLGLHLWLARVS
jgi:isoleucyl-tRNA synthetase